MDRDLSLVRWLTFAALLAVAGVFLLPELQRGDVMFLPTAVLVFVAALFFTWALELWLRLILQRVQNTSQKAVAPGMALPEVFALHRKFMQAVNPQEVLELMLASALEVSKALGCSFVPYDEWGATLPSLVRGNVPSSALQHWAERLSAPGTRQACKTCQVLGSDGDCVLLRNVPGSLDEVRCLTLKGDVREIGVINLYFEAGHVDLDDAQRAILEQVMLSAAAALQTLQRREDELATLRQMQASTSQRTVLTGLLDGLLSNLQKTLDVDFASFWIPGGIVNESARAGFLTSRTRDESVAVAALPDIRFIQGLWDSVGSTRQAVILSNVSLHEKELWRMLAAFPIMWNDDEPLGVLLVGARRGRGLSQQQTQLLKTIAGEAALIVLNARVMVEVEYQAVLDERARLAREIHDGLAQTLAFLKMQSDQMQVFLAQGKMDRLTDTLKASSRTLNDAYLDARQAIENLRRLPDVALDELLNRIAVEFTAATALPVDVSGVAPLRVFSPTVRAQLIRIVQESLANVRKHAQAQAVFISAREEHGDMILEIRDAGIGFAPEAIASPAQFGLRGMRERAEMIGAEFQVISRPGEGTTVRLQIPVEVGEEK